MIIISLILCILSLAFRAIIFFIKIGLLKQETQSFNIIKSVDAGVEIIAIIMSIALAIIGIISSKKNKDKIKEFSEEQSKIKNLVQTAKTDCDVILNNTIIFSEEDEKKFLNNLNALKIPYNQKNFDGDRESFKDFLKSNTIIINGHEMKIDDSKIKDTDYLGNIEVQIGIIKLQLKEIKNNDYKLPIPDVKNLNYSNESKTNNIDP